MPLKQDPKQYFSHLHDVEVNQKYAKTLPYSFHLDLVANQASRFSHHIPSDYPYYSAVWAAIYGHDSIEDARLTYNDVKEMFGEIAANIIYLCTEDKGRNRSERKSERWYQELRTNDLAVFVKLCDIIANSLFSLSTGSSMFKKYKSEYIQKVKPHLYCEEYKDMFGFLDKIYEL